MTNINLLFTCPHGGKKYGTTDNPPLQPTLTQRDDDNFKEDKCRSSDYLYHPKEYADFAAAHLARALDPVYHNKIRLHRIFNMMSNL